MLDRFYEIEPYSLAKAEKDALLSERVSQLTRHHYESCAQYGSMLDSIGFDPYARYSYKETPFLPVQLFKTLELKSISDDQVFKTMTSSGTTGQAVSRIFLDSQTANAQQKVLSRIFVSNFGHARMPMIIIDCPSVVKNRAMFSARGAGILGFSMFGTKRIYALNDDMSLNLEAIEEFLEKHAGEDIFLFGFTFMIWQHFVGELRKRGIKLDLSNGMLLHGGGWKKLASENVSNGDFKAALAETCSIVRVHDYYGMVEQTGSIYIECEEGHLHSSIFSDVIIRDVSDFSVCESGQRGVIQVVSSIPQSYPGHSLLTEDEGTLLGIDDCPCGRKGSYFKVHGRLENAEIRGCSDTYAQDFRRRRP